MDAAVHRRVRCAAEIELAEPVGERNLDGHRPRERTLLPQVAP